MDGFLHELEPPPTSNCVCCSVDFTKVSGAVSEILIFSANDVFERSVSVLEALSAIFTSRNLLKAKEKNFQVIMCPNCAEVVSNIYRDYLALLQLSTPNGYLCRLVSQLHTWHQFHQPGQPQLLVENEDGDFSPAVYTLDDDEDGEDYQPTQITVTDLFNLDTTETIEGAITTITVSAQEPPAPPVESPPKVKKSSTKSKSAALKERYRIKASTAQKKPKKPRVKAEGVPVLAGPKKTFPSRYQCRFINKRQFVNCKSCPEKFLYNWKLHDHHLVTHDGKVRDECCLCGFQYFPEVIKTESHVCLTDLHRFPTSRKKPFLCEMCGERFRAERMLQFHQEKEHVQDEIKFKCIQCLKNIKDRTKLIMHMETHNPDRKYLCTTCGVAFSQSRGLEKHRHTHSEPTLPCEVCGKLLKTKDTLVQHLKNVHSVGKNSEGELVETKPSCSATEKTEDLTGPHICEVCNKEFKSRRNVKEHFKYMHTGEVHRKFVCTVCDKREYTSSKLKRHMRQHLPVQQKGRFKERELNPNAKSPELGPHKCKYCARQYVYKNYLLDHIKLVHETARAAVKCSICERPFLNNRDAELHQRSHLGLDELANLQKAKVCVIIQPETGEFTFPCPDCDKVFKNRRRVVEHHRYLHSNTNMLPCPTCEKEFRKRSQLMIHLRTHSKRSPKRRVARKSKKEPKDKDYGSDLESVEEMEYSQEIKPRIPSSSTSRKSGSHPVLTKTSKPCPKSKKPKSPVCPTPRARARAVRRPLRYQSDSEPEVIIPDPIDPSEEPTTSARARRGGRASRSGNEDKAAGLPRVKVTLERDPDIEAAVESGSMTMTCLKIDTVSEEPDNEVSRDQFILGD